MDKIEEDRILAEVKNDWCNKFFAFNFDEDDSRTLINWLYKEIGYPEPKVVFLDSPKLVQIAAHILGAGTVKDMTEKQIKLEIMKNKNIETINRTNFTDYGCQCWDFGWVAYYDFAERTGKEKDKFVDYRRWIQRGPFLWIAYDECAFVSRPPILMDKEVVLGTVNEFRLHSTIGPAIKFKDGYNYYFVHAIPFKKEEWSAFFPKRLIKPDKIFQIANTEQRYAVMQEYGIEYVLDKCKSRVIDTVEEWSEPMKKTVKNRLLYITIDNRETGWLELSEHSHDKKYYEGVPVTCKTVAEALAWKYKENDPNGFKIIQAS